MAAGPQRPLRPRGEQEPGPAGSTLVTIAPGRGSLQPLFCVHAESGDVSLYFGMAAHLSPEQPVLGLCAPPGGEPGSHQRLEQIAETHVREIVSAQPDGSYLIVGECTGGALAYEISRQLAAGGREVALLALIDAFPTGSPRLHRLMPRFAYRALHRSRILGFHLKNLIRLDATARRAYISTKAGRARGAAAVRVSRIRSRSAGDGSARLAYGKALAAYDPAPYRGSAVLLRAARLPAGVQAPFDLGWGELIEDLEVEMVPGYFTTLISEPGVRQLADRLSRHLAPITG